MIKAVYSSVSRFDLGPYPLKKRVLAMSAACSPCPPLFRKDATSVGASAHTRRSGGPRGDDNAGGSLRIVVSMCHPDPAFQESDSIDPVGSCRRGPS